MDQGNFTSSFDEEEKKKKAKVLNPALANMEMTRTNPGGKMSTPGAALGQKLRTTFGEPVVDLANLATGKALLPGKAAVDLANTGLNAGNSALRVVTGWKVPGVLPTDQTTNHLASLADSAKNLYGAGVGAKDSALSGLGLERVQSPPTQPVTVNPLTEPPMAVSHSSGLPPGPPMAVSHGAGSAVNQNSLYVPDYGGGQTGNSLAAPPMVNGTRPQPRTPPPGEEKLLGMNKNALLKGLMATGLSMMDLGGRTYSTPVSAGSIIGQAGQVGMATYDQEKQNQRGAHLSDVKISEAEHDLQSKTGGQQFEQNQLNIAAAKLEVEKARNDLTAAKVDRTTKDKLNKILDELATEDDPVKFAALSARYSVMIGKSDGKSPALQQVKEKIKVGVDPLGSPIYMEQVVGYFDPGSGQTVRYEGGGQQTQYEEGKVYQDKDGNKAQWLNGKWVDYKG